MLFVFSEAGKLREVALALQPPLHLPKTYPHYFFGRLLHFLVASGRSFSIPSLLDARLTKSCTADAKDPTVWSWNLHQRLDAARMVPPLRGGVGGGGGGGRESGLDQNWGGGEGVEGT